MNPRSKNPQRGWRLRDRRIRAKLTIILTLPIIAILALTGLSTVSAWTQAIHADQGRQLVALGASGARLAAQLQHERAAVALMFAGKSGTASTKDYQRQAAASDALIVQFSNERARTSVPANLRPLVTRINDELADLPSLRQAVLTAPDVVLSVVTFRYRAVIADLMAYRQALDQIGVSTETANGLRAAAALSQAVESLGQMQVAVARTLIAGEFTPAAQQEIVAADAGGIDALQTFNDLAPPEWRALLNSKVNGPAIVQAERLQSLVTRTQPGANLNLGTDIRGWLPVVGARMDRMHDVEAELDAELLGAVTAERDTQQRTIIIQASVVATLLLVVIVVGWLVTRSLTGSLRQLQAGALDVAVQRLPQTVRELDVDNADRATIERLVARATEPIPLDGADEVGQVAAAFNSVAEAAVRLAGGQAALRAAVGAILVSLSRRLQLRADAMMVSLDGLQQDEQDPDRLKRLFDLDHIATLIRRLIFNLQILAGGRAGQPRTNAVPLPDMLRAAGQEIDDYVRVEFAEVDNSVEVNGDAASELIHMLAELLDNAARFSPPDSAVVMEARRVGDRLHIQIRDEGTGMRDADLQAARDRMANPQRIDQRATQQMGLPVVGAIAQRLAIEVDFRSNPGRGTRVDLTIPGGLFTRGRDPIYSPTAELQPVPLPALPPSTWLPVPVVAP